MSTLLILKAFNNCEWRDLLGMIHTLFIVEPCTFSNCFIMALVGGTYSKPYNNVD